VETPLKDDDDLKEKAIYIVSKNLSCSWETLADHLPGIDKVIIKKCKKVYSENEQQRSQMLRQWIETSDKSTFAQLFSTLKSCGDKKTATELAHYTTEKVQAEAKGETK
jgi:hypothetical protein